MGLTNVLLNQAPPPYHDGSDPWAGKSSFPLTTMGLTHEPINQAPPLPRWVWPRNRAGHGRSSCWPGSTGSPATSLPSPSSADGYSSRCQTGLSGNVDYMVNQASPIYIRRCQTGLSGNTDYMVNQASPIYSSRDQTGLSGAENNPLIKHSYT